MATTTPYYHTVDDQSASAPVAVTLVVQRAKPTPLADAYTLLAGQTLSISTTPTMGLLANDHNPDGAAAAAMLVNGPLHGTLVLSSDGSFVYKPFTGYMGEDSFSYVLRDGNTLSDTPAVVNLEVLSTPLQARPDAFVVHAGSQLSVDSLHGLLANDSGSSLAASLVTLPQNGVLLLNTDGSFTYRPFAGYTGSDSFKYQAGNVLTCVGGAVVEVSQPIDVRIEVSDSLPEAFAESYSLHVGTPLSRSSINGVLTNDRDPNGDPVMAQLVNSTSNGVLNFQSDGSFTYRPGLAFKGVDQFVYRTGANGLWSGTVTVRLVVSDTLPVAHDDFALLNSSRELTVSDGRLLANDFDVDGDGIRVELVTGVASGQLILNSDGTYAYKPNPGFYGSDQFQYRVLGPHGAGSTATVRLVVANTAPRAGDNFFQGRPGQKIRDTLLPAASGNPYRSFVPASDADNDPLEAVLVTKASNGTLWLESDGRFEYKPRPGFSGFDSFTYKVFDGQAYSNVATVRLYVFDGAPKTSEDEEDTHSVFPLYAVPQAWQTITNSASQLASSVASTSVLWNDTDPDGDQLYARLITVPIHGSFEFHTDGTYSYVPDYGYVGADSFSYRAWDGTRLGNIVTVSLNVENEVPVGTPESYFVAPNANVSSNVLANDYDVDGDPMIARLVTNVSSGRLNWSEAGTFTYIPDDPDNPVADSFTYRVGDGKSWSSDITVTLTITPPPPAPPAPPAPPVAPFLPFQFPRTANFSVGHDKILMRGPDNGVLGNSFDRIVPITVLLGPLPPPLSPPIMPLHALRFEMLASGSFVYVPNPGYVGRDRFTFVTSDGRHGVANIDVTNQTPTSAMDTYFVAHDTRLYITASEGVLANDSDPDSDVLTMALTSDVVLPNSVQFVPNTDGSFSWQPPSGSFGRFAFSYQPSDGPGLFGPTAIAIINVAQTPPISRPDGYIGVQDRPLTVNAIDGVSINDFDWEDGLLFLTPYDGPVRVRRYSSTSLI